MTKYGYGAPEETLYLKAYNFAKDGHPTLLFSFEAAKNKLINSLISHLLKIDIEDLKKPSGEVLKQIEESGIHNVPLSYVDEASMSLEEIEKVIRKNVQEKNITHVVLDRVDDAKKVKQLALKLGVKIYY